MTGDMAALFVGLVFVIVFVVSQILVIPSFAGGADNRKLKQRLEDIIQEHGKGDSEVSIVKEKYLKRLGFVEKNLECLPGMPELKALLEQAGKKHMAYRFVLYELLASVSVALVAWSYSGYIMMAIVAFIIMMTLPVMWLKKLRAKRLDKFEEQLPEALQMMSRALRTGYPFSECLKMISTEMSEPISHEFGMTFEEINYGRGIEVAFALMIERVPSLSLIAMVTAVLIQRDTGGNLAEVLMKISDVLRGRFKLQRRIKTLAAEGMLSAWVMVMLPIVLFVAMQIVNPEYYNIVWESPNKMTFLYIFVGLLLFAALWIRDIVNIDV